MTVKNNCRFGQKRDIGLTISLQVLIHTLFYSFSSSENSLIRPICNVTNPTSDGKLYCCSHLITSAEFIRVET